MVRVVALLLSMVLAANAEAGRFSQLILDAANATRPGPAPPTPNPPSDICEECNGTGKLGDSTVWVMCPVCNGTGKKKTAGAAGKASTPTVSTEAPPLSADEQPTPWDGVDAGLNILAPQPDEVLVDFGCGRDARWLIHAVQHFGVKRAIGVEIDPQAAESARRCVAEAGLSDRIEIVTADAITANVKADIGVAYLWSETLAKLRPQIEKLKRFVSYGFPVPGLEMEVKTAPNGGKLYLWQPKPLPVVQNVPITRTVRQTVGLPRGSWCQVCGRACQNPMQHLLQRQIIGWEQRMIYPNAYSKGQMQVGRWVTQKVCVNGRCSMQRVWMPY